MLSTVQRQKFYSMVHAAVRAGLPPDGALTMLPGTVRHRPGVPLSSLLRRHAVLPEADLSVLSIAESTGTVESAVSLLIAHTRRQAETERRLRAAVRYPLFLVILSPFLSNAAALVTGELTVLGYLYHALLPALFLLGVILVLQRLVRIRSVQGVLHQLPGIGPFLREVSVWRLLSMAHLLVRAGVGVRDAFRTLGADVAYPRLADGIRRWDAALEGGVPLDAAFLQLDGLASGTVQLLSTGAQTGQLDQMLEKSAAYLATSLDSRLKMAQTVLPTIALFGAMLILAGQITF